LPFITNISIAALANDEEERLVDNPSTEQAGHKTSHTAAELNTIQTIKANRMLKLLHQSMASKALPTTKEGTMGRTRDTLADNRPTLRCSHRKLYTATTALTQVMHHHQVHHRL